MDEAERCGRIVYLANGRIVVQGTGDEVASRSGLITYEGTGANLDAAAGALRQRDGVESAAVFGHVLHVAGTDRAKLEAAIRHHDGALSWHMRSSRGSRTCSFTG